MSSGSVKRRALHSAAGRRLLPLPAVFTSASAFFLSESRLATRFGFEREGVRL